MPLRSPKMAPLPVPFRKVAIHGDQAIPVKRGKVE